MAISINWGTHVINIPQADLTPVSGTLYSLDTNQFRLDLKALEASVPGIVEPITHVHNTEVTVAGITYARFIEIVPPYSVEFEDGQYSVRLEGSNNNIFDVENGILVQNQVQVIPGNAAGLQVVTSGSGVLPSDITDIAEAVWEELSSNHTNPDTLGLLISQIKLLTDELHKIQGLDISNPMTMTPTLRSAGSISLEVAGDGETVSVVTRQ